MQRAPRVAEALTRIPASGFATALMSVGFTHMVTTQHAHGQTQARTSGPRITVTDAWARPALQGGTGGIYLTVTNRTDAPVSVVRATARDASAVELHETSIQSGMAHMTKQSVLTVGAREATRLAPGGRHYMLLKLGKAFTKGDSTRLVLHLDRGDSVVVTVHIRVP